MNILELGLAEAAQLVKKKEVSPVELVGASLQRIDEVDSRLAAYITVFNDQALAVAKASEAMLMAGHDLGPLHGIPVALKDNIAVKGTRTTAGSKVLANWFPDHDATVTLRLRNAGAIILGKCNMHEFAWGGTSHNPHYGAVRNPWDTSRFPAGSSGGSGAAVAARTCFGALGTDTGGSIRLPSAVNGIVGLRPTYGRVSNHGIIPLAWSMDTAGPMTRRVEDAALMLNAIAGHDLKDGSTATAQVDDYTRDLTMGLQGLRVGMIPEYFLSHLQPDVRAAMTDALEVLQGMGAKVVNLDMSLIEGNISAQLTIESAEPSTYHQRWLRERPEDYGDDVRSLLEVGELLLATHYIQAQRYRTALRQEFLDAFRRVDVFVCPTLPFTATKVGETLVEIEPGKPEDMLSAIMQFTGVPSLTGLPALNMPCGFDRNGMPIGMQIIGRPFDETTLFRVGSQFEQATRFYEQFPNLC